MKKETSELQLREGGFELYTIQELIQIVLSEDKSRKYKCLYSTTNNHEEDRREKNELRVAESIKLNGFEYFVNRLIEKESYLSASVRTDLIKYLFTADNLKHEMKKKVI